MKKDERLNFSDRTPSVRRLVVSLVLMLLAALPAAAQNKKITVDLDNVPVREFIKTVESQSGYTFAYNNSEIDLTRRVSVKAADENVVDVVIRALSAQNLTARMEGSRIVVSRKPAAARVQTAQPVRGGVVTGTVKTISGEPVIGASVIVLETNRGNVTGLEGDFSVEATPGQTLSVSFLGYNTQQIKVGSQTSFDITLTEDSKQISEVLVVGYTPMRKSDFTGSIASVKASELSATTPTVGQSLVGKVAGVEVHQTSGAPGDGVTIRVRGVNSLSASSAPLYVIDGYPASEDVFINPNDIESIDILKDAASAAIYGSRGASGVVLITTKRGKDGEAAKVSYDFSYGIQQLDHKVDLLNSTQFRDLLIDARNNSYRLRATAAGVSWSPYDDNTIRAAKGFSLAEVGIHPMFYDFTTRTPVTPQYDTDWQDELFSNAGIMRHNVSVIGGTKAIKYMASVGYMDQDGIIAPSNHNRINARINLDAQITKRLTASISYSMYDAKNTVVQAEGRMINDGVIQSALMYLPNLPAYEENGDYARSAMIRMKTDWGMNFPENPLAIANELDINEKMSRHNLNLNLVYEFLPDLKLSARLGQQWYNYRYFYYRPMSIGRDAAPAYSEELRSSNIARTTSTTTNMSGAKIRNRGFDVQLDARLLTGKVNWNFSTNISVNRNKVVSMGGLDDIISTTERSVGSHITKEGKPIGSFYGYQAVGIMSKADYANALLDRDVYIKNGNKFPEGYQLKGPAVASYALDNLSYGNAIWKDANGDGVITTDDKTIIGDAYPDFTGGFSTSLSWNGLDFSASFAYSYGGEVINFQDYYLYNMEGSGNQYSIVADRYISDAQPGRNNVPIASRISTTNTSLKLSSYYVEDASFFRCANITLGYTLPKRWTSKLHITSCRVYVSGDNLFTITPYRGYNPEVSYKSSNMMPGFDWGCYPLSRIYSVGLNLTF